MNKMLITLIGSLLVFNITIPLISAYSMRTEIRSGDSFVGFYAYGTGGSISFNIGFIGSGDFSTNLTADNYNVGITRDLYTKTYSGSGLFNEAFSFTNYVSYWGTLK